MRPKELVPILATAFGVPAEKAYVIDRDLFEKGWRAKGKGRSWPDMTRHEALYFLIGCAVVMTTPTAAATRAAEGVAMWASARSKLDVTGQMVSEDELAAFGPPFPDEQERQRILGQRYDRAAKLPFLAGMHGRTVTLVDYLIMMMHHFDAQGAWDDLILTLSPTHHVAEVKISVDQHEWDVERFHVPKRPRVADDRSFGVHITIPERFLRTVAAHTADPLAEGGGE